MAYMAPRDLSKNKVPLSAGEKADRDYVVLLSDFHNSTSGQIMSNLKKRLIITKIEEKRF